ncbi:RNA polymerase sigma factor [Cytophagaceae bacterium DM2B3-1]|uniref:RNA polymerase sigma factor n=1 Tax=Xanthocytophaga flava TaxID=3048013 RepID=A0ABT7CKW6_9BACT|nr:RNA polymerase sigma factor [Xanthocytophaga flavus]MDJ1469888.1 RNA polymerase sigma factor [Xanthocytophaga flavus]MDJ1494400.1 RNA polymerase sigma factor [Xanthocytophaga flavus]
MTFEEIYTQYSPKVYRLCMGYVNDPDQAKDLVQDTFIQVWDYLPGFRNESGVGTWVFTIATNTCLRQLKKEKKQVRTEMPLQLEEKPADTMDEQVAFLYKCIASLEENERLIISLVLEEVPQKQIADIIGISEGNIRVRIHRIKEKLSSIMKYHGQL